MEWTKEIYMKLINVASMRGSKREKALAELSEYERTECLDMIRMQDEFYEENGRALIWDIPFDFE